MEIKISEMVGTSLDGFKMYRHYFFNNDNTNYLVKAQSYFNKDAKKLARLRYKLKQNEF